MDEKTPLLRASDALSKEGSRLCKLLGYDTEAVTANIGLEQEIFLIPRDVSNHWNRFHGSSSDRM